jgi:hypothetical protein
MVKYTVGPMEADDINNRFTYHKPKDDQNKRYVGLREAARMLAWSFHECCPPCRERSLAITKLEEAIFWANASIARNEHEIP